MVSVGYRKENNIEQQGVAVCGESRKHGFEWEDWEAILTSTPNRGLMVKVWIKTRPMRQWSVSREYRLRLKIAFDEAGISISVPQQNISVRTNGGAI